MPAWSSIENVVTGIVRSVNEKGLKLDGQESWFNVSKYAVGVVLPERGAAVACTLDKAGFLRAVDSLDGLPAPVSGGSDHCVARTSSATQTTSPAPAAAPSTREGAAPHISDCVRHRTITRLAVLKAAAEFGAARPSLKSGDVLAIAASWERWINRDEETTYDLTDAF